MLVYTILFVILFISNGLCLSDPDDIYTIGLLSERNYEIDKEIMNSIKLAFTEVSFGRAITFNFEEEFYDDPNECGQKVEDLISKSVSAIFGGISHECLVNASSVLKNSNVIYLTTAFGLDSECNSNVISSVNFIRRLSTIMAPQYHSVVFLGEETSYYMKLAKQMYSQYNLYNIFNNTNFDFLVYSSSSSTGESIGEELVNTLLPSGGGGYLISFLENDILSTIFPDIKAKIGSRKIKLVCFFQTCSSLYHQYPNVFDGQLLYSSFINQSSLFYDYYTSKYPSPSSSSSSSSSNDILITEYMFNSFLLALSFRKAVTSTHFTLPSIIKPVLSGIHTFDGISININSNNIFVTKFNIYSIKGDSNEFVDYGNMTIFNYINPYSISPFLPEYYEDIRDSLSICESDKIIEKPVHHIIILHKEIVITLFADYLEAIFYELININYHGGLQGNNNNHYYILPHFLLITNNNFIKYMKFYMEEYNVKTIFGVEPSVEMNDEFYEVIESKNVMFFVLSPSSGNRCSPKIMYVNTVLYYSVEFLFSITPFIPEYQYPVHIIIQEGLLNMNYINKKMLLFQYGHIIHFISNCQNVTDIMNNKIMPETSTNYTILTLMNICHEEFFSSLGTGNDNIRGVLPMFISSYPQLKIYGNQFERTLLISRSTMNDVDEDVSDFIIKSLTPIKPSADVVIGSEAFYIWRTSVTSSSSLDPEDYKLHFYDFPVHDGNKIVYSNYIYSNLYLVNFNNSVEVVTHQSLALNSPQLVYYDTNDNYKLCIANEGYSKVESELICLILDITLSYTETFTISNMNFYISSKYDDYIILYQTYQCELSNITCIDIAMNECVNMKANYTVGLFTEEVVEKIQIYFDRIQVINLLSYSNYECHVNFTKYGYTLIQSLESIAKLFHDNTIQRTDTMCVVGPDDIYTNNLNNMLKNHIYTSQFNIKYINKNDQNVNTIINTNCKNSILISTCLTDDDFRLFKTLSVDSSVTIVHFRYINPGENEYTPYFKNHYFVGLMYAMESSLYQQILSSLLTFLESINYQYTFQVIPSLPLYLISAVQMTQYLYTQSIPLTFNSFEDVVTLYPDKQIGRYLRLLFFNGTHLSDEYKSLVPVIHLSFLRYYTENWNEFCSFLYDEKNPIMRVEVVLVGILYNSVEDYSTIYSMIAAAESTFRVETVEDTIVKLIPIKYDNNNIEQKLEDFKNRYSERIIALFQLDNDIDEEIILGFCDRNDVPVIRLFMPMDLGCSNYIIDAAFNPRNLYYIYFQLLIKQSSGDKVYIITDGSEIALSILHKLQTDFTLMNLVIYTNEITSNGNSEELYLLMKDIILKFPDEGLVIYICNECKNTVTFYNYVYTYLLHLNDDTNNSDKNDENDEDDDIRNNFHPYLFITNDPMYDYISILDKKIFKNIIFISDFLYDDNKELNKYYQWKSTLLGSVGMRIDNKGIYGYSLYSILFNAIRDSTSYEYSKWSFFIYNRIYSSPLNDIILTNDHSIFTDSYFISYNVKNDSFYLTQRVGVMVPSVFLDYRYTYLSYCEMKRSESYRIGILHPFTPKGLFSKYIDNVIQIFDYFQVMNYEGGIMGKYVEPFVVDIGSDEITTRNVLMKIFENGNGNNFNKPLTFVGGHIQPNIRQVISEVLVEKSDEKHHYYLWNIYEIADLECFPNIFNLNSVFYLKFLNAMNYIFTRRITNVLYVLSGNEKLIEVKKTLYNYYLTAFQVNTTMIMPIESRIDLLNKINKITTRSEEIGGEMIGIVFDIDIEYKRIIYPEINKKNSIKEQFFCVDINIIDDYNQFKDYKENTFSFLLNYHKDYELLLSEKLMDENIHSVLTYTSVTSFTPIIASIPYMIEEIGKIRGTFEGDWLDTIINYSFLSPEGYYIFNDNLLVTRPYRFGRYMTIVDNNNNRNNKNNKNNENKSNENNGSDNNNNNSNSNNKMVMVIDYFNSETQEPFLYSILYNNYGIDEFMDKYYCNFNTAKSYSNKYLIIVVTNDENNMNKRAKVVDNNNESIDFTVGAVISLTKPLFIDNIIVTPYYIKVDVKTTTSEELIEKLNPMKDKILSFVGCQNMKCIEIIKPFLSQCKSDQILITSVEFLNECNPHIVTIGYPIYTSIVHAVNHFMALIFTQYIVIYDNSCSSESLKFLLEYIDFYKSKYDVFDISDMSESNSEDKSDEIIQKFKSYDKVVVLAIIDDSLKIEYLYKYANFNHIIVLYNIYPPEEVFENDNGDNGDNGDIVVPVDNKSIGKVKDGVYIMNQLTFKDGTIIQQIIELIESDYNHLTITTNMVLGYLSIHFLEYIFETFSYSLSSDNIENNQKQFISSDFTIFEVFHYFSKTQTITNPIFLLQYDSNSRGYKLVHRFTNLHIFKNKFPQYSDQYVGRACDFQNGDSNHETTLSVKKIALLFSFEGKYRYYDIPTVLGITQTLHYISKYDDNNFYLPYIVDIKSDSTLFEQEFKDIIKDEDIVLVMTGYLNQSQSIMKRNLGTNSNKLIMIVYPYTGVYLSPNVLYSRPTTMSYFYKMWEFYSIEYTFVHCIIIRYNKYHTFANNLEYTIKDYCGDNNKDEDENDNNFFRNPLNKNKSNNKSEKSINEQWIVYYDIDEENDGSERINQIFDDINSKYEHALILVTINSDILRILIKTLCERGEGEENGDSFNNIYYKYQIYFVYLSILDYYTFLTYCGKFNIVNPSMINYRMLKETEEIKDSDVLNDKNDLLNYRSFSYLLYDTLYLDYITDDQYSTAIGLLYYNLVDISYPNQVLISDYFIYKQLETKAICKTLDNDDENNNSKIGDNNNNNNKNNNQLVLSFQFSPSLRLKSPIYTTDFRDSNYDLYQSENSLNIAGYHFPYYIEIDYSETNYYKVFDVTPICIFTESTDNFTKYEKYSLYGIFNGMYQINRNGGLQITYCVPRIFSYSQLVEMIKTKEYGYCTVIVTLFHTSLLLNLKDEIENSNLLVISLRNDIGVNCTRRIVHSGLLPNQLGTLIYDFTVTQQLYNLIVIYNKDDYICQFKAEFYKDYFKMKFYRSVETYPFDYYDIETIKNIPTQNRTNTLYVLLFGELEHDLVDVNILKSIREAMNFDSNYVYVDISPINLPEKSYNHLLYNTYQMSSFYEELKDMDHLYTIDDKYILDITEFINNARGNLRMDDPINSVFYIGYITTQLFQSVVEATGNATDVSTMLDLGKITIDIPTGTLNLLENNYYSYSMFISLYSNEGKNNIIYSIHEFNVPMPLYDPSKTSILYDCKINPPNPVDVYKRNFRISKTVIEFVYILDLTNVNQIDSSFHILSSITISTREYNNKQNNYYILMNVKSYSTIEELSEIVSSLNQLIIMVSSKQTLRYCTKQLTYSSLIFFINDMSSCQEVTSNSIHIAMLEDHYSVPSLTYGSSIGIENYYLIFTEANEFSKSILDHFVYESENFNFTKISYANFTPTCNDEDDVKKFRDFITSVINSQKKCAFLFFIQSECFNKLYIILTSYPNAQEYISIFLYFEQYNILENYRYTNFKIYIIGDYISGLITGSNFEDVIISNSNNYLSANIYTFHAYISVPLIMNGFELAKDYAGGDISAITPKILRYSLYNSPNTFSFGTYSINNTNTLSFVLYIAQVSNFFSLNAETEMNPTLLMHNILSYNRNSEIKYYTDSLRVACIVLDVIDMIIIVSLCVGIFINYKSVLFSKSGLEFDMFILIGSFVLILYNTISFSKSLYEVFNCAVKYPVVMILNTFYIAIYGSKILKGYHYYLNLTNKLNVITTKNIFIAMIIFAIPQILLSFLNIIISVSTSTEEFSASDSDILQEIYTIKCNHEDIFVVLQLILHDLIVIFLILISIKILKVPRLLNEQKRILAYLIIYIVYFAILPTLSYFGGDTDLNLIVWELGMNVIIVIGPLLLFVPKFITIYFDKDFDAYTGTPSSSSSILTYSKSKGGSKKKQTTSKVYPLEGRTKTANHKTQANTKTNYTKLHTRTSGDINTAGNNLNNTARLNQTRTNHNNNNNNRHTKRNPSQMVTYIEKVRIAQDTSQQPSTLLESLSNHKNLNNNNNYEGESVMVNAPPVSKKTSGVMLKQPYGGSTSLGNGLTSGGTAAASSGNNNNNNIHGRYKSSIEESLEKNDNNYKLRNGSGSNNGNSGENKLGGTLSNNTNNGEDANALASQLPRNRTDTFLDAYIPDIE